MSAKARKLQSENTLLNASMAQHKGKKTWRKKAPADDGQGIITIEMSGGLCGLMCDPRSVQGVHKIITRTVIL